MNHGRLDAHWPVEFDGLDGKEIFVYAIHVSAQHCPDSSKFNASM